MGEDLTSGWHIQPDGSQRFWDGSQWVGKTIPPPPQTDDSDVSTTQEPEPAFAEDAMDEPGTPLRGMKSHTLTRKRRNLLLVAFFVGIAVIAGGINLIADTNKQESIRVKSALRSSVQEWWDARTVSQQRAWAALARHDELSSSSDFNSGSWLKGWPATDRDAVKKEALALADGLVFASAIQPGTHRVGYDPGQIEPGTYAASGGEGCYWERTWPSGEIIENNFKIGKTRVEVWIRPSDWSFTSRDCGLWFSDWLNY